jgi:hypothetical protein
VLVPLGINLSGGEIESTNAALNAPPDKTRQLPLASTSLKRSTGALHAYGTGCRACHAGKITPFLLMVHGVVAQLVRAPATYRWR